MDRIAAAFAGDMVGSTRAGTAQTDRAFAILAAAAADIGRWAGHDTRMTRFRGDGWQLYLDTPLLSLDAALYLLACLRAADAGVTTRLAIGFGTVERLGSADLSDAAGEAFALAGQALDDMPRHARIVLANRQVVAEWHQAVFELAIWTASRWSQPQAEAVALAMKLGMDPPTDPIHPEPTQPEPTQPEPTQADLATRLGITRQAVQARLHGAGWDPLQSATGAIRRHDWVQHHA